MTVVIDLFLAFCELSTCISAHNIFRVTCLLVFVLICASNIMLLYIMLIVCLYGAFLLYFLDMSITLVNRNSTVTVYADLQNYLPSLRF